jgi:hypothetical protein
MRSCLILKTVILIAICSCSNPDKKEVPATVTTATEDTATKATVIRYLTTDFPVRAYAFKKMPDSTTEEQVLKYEQFAVLFVEYVGINESKPLYSAQDQVANTEAFNVIRDEMFGFKMKLKKQMNNFSKAQEARLDAADAKMNKFLPQGTE